ncbi:radical activating enzyme [Olavius algarvensis associated proteobacterium Delta 3]|nr:radical activating enzyme [Olavius algarvensis associated proteobacterium Delta 3]
METDRRHFMQCCLRWAALGLCPFLPGALFAGLSTAAKPKQAPDRLKPSVGGSSAHIDPDFEPAYVSLHRTGELKGRGDALWQVMSECALCPRQCGAERLAGETGFCRAPSRLQIASFHPHFGEERPLVGRGGSGTIFLSHCGLRCVFCINWQVSHGGVGRANEIDDLARMMLRLQEIGCHNINVVTPTHYSAHIVRALDQAAAEGLRLPVVYNTCGWERLEILQLLDGIVNIYLPDFKYADGQMAATYSAGADSYPQVTKTALMEMHRQVGVAKPAEDGLMYQGLMIRHLVMPNNVGGTRQVVEWIAEHLPKETYVNIMSQYRPMYRAEEFPKIARRLTRKEYQDAVHWAREAGLTNLDVQGSLFLD